MSGIITPAAYALTLAAAGTANRPEILWANSPGPSDYAADEEAEGYPVTNLANSITIEGWRGSTTDPQAVTITLDPSQEISAFGIERHNLGSSGAMIALEGVPAGDDPLEPGDWVEIVADHVTAGDGTHMGRFTPDHYEAVRLAITPDTEPPRMAVFWVGKRLTMERGVQPHTPIGWAVQREVQTGRNRAGDFLGRVITQTMRRTSAQFANVTPDWVRSSDWLAFAASAASQPFFFAWAPQTYPAEVGFCTALNDLIAETQTLAGFANITIDMEAAGS